MKMTHFRTGLTALPILVLLAGTTPLFAGVSRAIQDKYRRNYENKALFLKIPVFSEKQYVFITGETFRAEQGPIGAPTRFNVGDQVRVLGLDFSGDEIKFKLSGIAAAATTEIIFKFDSDLQEDFPNSGIFDRAIGATFTEGLMYTELEEAKRGYIEDQFDRVVREIAATSGTGRDEVLKNMAPRIPAYQDAVRDVKNLQSRNQDLKNQLAQVQSEKRSVESELSARQVEISRMRNQNAALQEKIDASTSQLSKLSADLRSAQGLSDDYQRELSNLQRSLKIKVDANRDLVSQIGELGKVMERAQKDNEELAARGKALQASLDSEKSTNARLSAEIEDLKSSSRKMQQTIATLTSKEDSLARQYMQLKETKEKLETVTTALAGLETRVVEEKSEGGIRSGKTDVYLGKTLLGAFDWRLPESVAPGGEGDIEARFSAESIDYVKVDPAERQILQSLGDRLKLSATLISRSEAMEVKPLEADNPQEVGERAQGVWRWKLVNRGSEDARLRYGLQLTNKNGDEIPVLKVDETVLSSSVVRQARSYLQPVPLAVGAVLGFLLFGIVGIFRKSKPPSRRPQESSSRYTGKKQL